MAGMNLQAMNQGAQAMLNSQRAQGGGTALNAAGGGGTSASGVPMPSGSDGSGESGGAQDGSGSGGKNNNNGFKKGEQKADEIFGKSTIVKILTFGLSTGLSVKPYNFNVCLPSFGPCVGSVKQITGGLGLPSPAATCSSLNKGKEGGPKVVMR